MKPIKSRIQLWVEDLRTTRAGQTQGTLRRARASDGRHSGYCCLGRACEVYRKATGKGEWKGSTFVVGKEYATAYLPLPVVKWFGFAAPNPLVNFRESNLLSVRAAQLNDHYNKSFAQIADLVEATYLEGK